MRYSKSLNYVLYKLTFVIQAGEKIGLVGRTGAGKSSIFQAIYRIVELEKAKKQFIKIDGIDISKIKLSKLR